MANLVAPPSDAGFAGTGGGFAAYGPIWSIFSVQILRSIGKFINFPDGLDKPTLVSENEKCTKERLPIRLALLSLESVMKRDSIVLGGRSEAEAKFSKNPKKGKSAVSSSGTTANRGRTTAAAKSRRVSTSARGKASTGTTGGRKNKNK